MVANWFFSSFLVIFLILFVGANVHGQEPDSALLKQPLIYMIVKNDGVKFVGEILKEDAREVLIRTDRIGEVYVPRHEIKEIKLLPGKIDLSAEGEYIDEELFATRYFITTNGLSIKKGENYMIWNLYGPDFQFGIADNLGVGVMTSWFAVPIIGTIKYSRHLTRTTSMAIGGLAGTGSWAYPEFGLLLPYASFTAGNRKTNFTFTVGYGLAFYEQSIWNPISFNDDKMKRSEGRLLLSVAGMSKITPKLSLVFDTFIMPRGAYKDYEEWVDRSYINENGDYVSDYKMETVRKRSPNLAILLPGLRWQIEPNKAFQFGFTGVHFDGEFLPTPIPMVQWYRKL
jgi:hypothetical protein